MSQLQYDELFVVSDIHMGGKPGTQILKYEARLGALLAQLAKLPESRKVAFVLNGDVIDSLAEGLGHYVALSERELDLMLDRIFQHFPNAWNGMAEFACSKGRQLVFVIGNHDIELSLAQTQTRILERLQHPESQLSPNVLFFTAGEGFTCNVGGAKVHCTHGNEVDGWNVVDYDQLQSLSDALEHGKAYSAQRWRPNAGTKLVVDVMNDVKQDFPFVDLLKPETNQVLAVLLTIKPELIDTISVDELTGIGVERLRGELKRLGLLSADAESMRQVSDHQEALGVATRELFGPRTRALLEMRADLDANDLLLAIEQDLRAGKRATDLAEAEAAKGTLGWFQMLVDRVSGVDKVEALRAALLDWSGEDDDAFSLAFQDDTCKRLKKDATQYGYDFTIAGHTHLERAIPFGGGRFYYNSGTWIRLLRLPRALLESPSEFRRIYATLDGGTLSDLDALEWDVTPKDRRPAILDQAAVVHINGENGKTTGRLCRVIGEGVEVTLEAIRDTEFVK